MLGCFGLFFLGYVSGCFVGLFWVVLGGKTPCQEVPRGKYVHALGLQIKTKRYIRTGVFFKED